MYQTKQHLRALLVGIDNYHPDSHKHGVKDLTGCKNDVEAMTSLIKEKYAFLQPNIQTLVDSEATRENIINGFRNHLQKDVDNNTTVLFYFSGHGSMQYTSQHFQKYIADKEHNFEETLVCYESRVSNKHLDLADKELAILIKEIAQKDAHIVIILDSCHSGGGTRNLEPSENLAIQKRIEGIREVGMRSTQNSLRRKYLDNYYQNLIDQNKEVKIPESKYILLAGCERDQYSRETTKEGVRRGAFTYFLEQTLRSYNQITYANLFSVIRTEILKEDFQQSQYPQYPQCKPYQLFDSYTYFLQGNSTKNQDLRYELSYDAETEDWVVELGAVMGLPLELGNKALFAIYKTPGSDQEIAFAKAIWIGLNQSGLELINGDLSVTERYWAKLISMPLAKLPVYFDGEPDLIQSLETELNQRKSPYIEFSSSLDTTYRIVMNNQGYEIYKQDKPIFTHKSNNANSSGAIYKLEQIARWYILLNTNHEQTKLNPSEVEFNLLEGESLSSAVQPKQIIHQEKAYYEIIAHKGGFSKRKSEEWFVPYLITAQNNSESHLYFTLLYFSSKYGINVYKQEKAPPKSGLVVLTDEYILSPGDGLESIDYFKLIVSTKEIKPFLFEQAALDSDNLRDSHKRTKVSIFEDWFTKTIEVKTIKNQKK